MNPEDDTERCQIAALLAVFGITAPEAIDYLDSTKNIKHLPDGRIAEIAFLTFQRGRITVSRDQIGIDDHW